LLTRRESDIHLSVREETERERGKEEGGGEVG